MTESDLASELEVNSRDLMKWIGRSNYRASRNSHSESARARGEAPNRSVGTQKIRPENWRTTCRRSAQAVKVK